MFGRLKKKSVVVSRTPLEKLLLAALDEGRNEIAEREKTRLEIAERENPETLARIIAARNGRPGTSPEQILLEDTVRTLLRPKPEEATPEPADELVSVTSVPASGFRMKIALLLVRLACWLTGKPIGNKVTTLTVMPSLKTSVPGEHGHHHVHDNRYSTGIENARLEKDRNEVVKIQSARNAALANEPVRKQLAARGQEENPEKYLEGVEQIDAITLQNHALASDTMSEAIDEQNARSLDQGQTPVAQDTQGGRKDV